MRASLQYRSNRTVVAAGVAVTGLLFSSLPAEAAFQFQLVETGGPTLLVTDQGAGDLNPAVGIIQVGSGIAFGDFTVFGLTATSNRASGSGNQIAQIDLSSLMIRNNTSAPHTLGIMVGDTDYTFPTIRPLDLTASGSGTFAVVPGTGATSVSGSSANLSSFADAANGQFATAFPAENFVFNAPASPTASFADPVTIAAGFNPAGSYSMTLSDQFTVAGNTQLISLGQVLSAQTGPIPEPACALLIAAAPLVASQRPSRKRSRASRSH